MDKYQAWVRSEPVGYRDTVQPVAHTGKVACRDMVVHMDKDIDMDIHTDTDNKVLYGTAYPVDASQDDL